MIPTDALHGLKQTAMRLARAGAPLAAESGPAPVPGEQDVLLEVLACGVCRTDLHLVDGDLPDIPYPITPGHEVVGRVIQAGSAVADVRPGDRLGVPWLAHTCGACSYCLEGRENLCDHAQFTGYTLNGGYARYILADARFCLRIPDRYEDGEAAPLLCAGLIGYRAYRMAGTAARLGLYGFGAAAHLLAQIAKAEGREVFAFTRPGDETARKFARDLGVDWAGGSDEAPPHELDCAILFAPDGGLVPRALSTVRKGGQVVCAGIHMSDVPGFPYSYLWGERSIRSVANLTREDGRLFMDLAARLALRPRVQLFELSRANEALDCLRRGRLTGAAVLCPSGS